MSNISHLDFFLNMLDTLLIALCPDVFKHFYKTSAK